MELQFGFLADAVQPSEGGKLCALGIGIDRVVAAAFPARHGSLAVVARLRFERGEDAGAPDVALLFGLVGGPKRLLIGQPLPPPESGRDVDMEGVRYHTVSLSTFGLELSGPGSYAFEVAVGGTVIGSIPLWVDLAGE